MIKVLADKVLGFHNGDQDEKGNLIICRTKIGFCELPDWVAKSAYYKAAILDGSLRPFENSASSEEVLKDQEKLQALKDEIKALEEKRDLLNTSNEIIENASKTKSKDKSKDETKDLEEKGELIDPANEITGKDSETKK
ncbi:hypothetical protein CLPUN_42310 [Clostridium puniceum]|uniref:Uncharacterized protein n=1 Tax=Clostridium puniceum TaxID=29367 RepID=A0A1S8T8B8_9CLOT|nr:hypothetical protein [Clostridium puniceum]OOM73993.1 hypothetical protein CLPUN_42310 [Clostridium puniceum]